MKISKIVFAFALISFNAVLIAHVDPITINDMVLHVRDSNENLHTVSKEDISFVQGLLNDKKTLATIDVNKLSSDGKAMLLAILKECETKIVEATKKEELLKTIGFSGFFGTALLAALFGYDPLPHVDNKFIDEQLHSSMNHSYLLIALSVGIFYTLYKAQGYQNERIALEEVQEVINSLKEVLN